MDQRKLHKMVEAIASQSFSSDKEMLVSVVNQIIDNEDIDVIGGRVWQLDLDEEGYKLLFQTGDVNEIPKKFIIKIKEYPIFDFIAKERTILGSETNELLREKGIFKYSASGVGEKLKVDGKFYYEYLLALNSNEIDENLRVNLSIIATALTSQIKQKRSTQSAGLLKAGLDKARELQKSILPEHEYRFFNYEIFGLTDPAEIIGGDFFDYHPISEDRLGVTVGDAASKGISAAAEAMYISGAIRMASSFEIKIASFMKKTNQLVNKIFADDKFASLFYGEISSDNGGLFLYANAGHNPPFFIKHNSDEIINLNPTGPVLGPVPHAKYTVENINFEKGDVLLIYSDGLIDTTNAETENFGEERLIDILRKVKHLSPKEITYSIVDELIKFSKNGIYTDDKTMVVLKRIK